MIVIHKFKLNTKLEYQNKKYESSLYICLHSKPKLIWTYLGPCQTSMIEYFCGNYINFRKKAPFQTFDKILSTILKNDGTSDLLS